jgi:hypothetical protein
VALLTHWQAGQPDYSTMPYEPYHGWGRRRRSYYDDQAENGGCDNSQVEMEEVYEEKLSLDHWLDLHGRKLEFGKIHLEDAEILTLENRKGWSLRQEISEATGNEGASMERWYRQGVIVLWPAGRTFRILAGEGQASALPELERNHPGFLWVQA